MADDYDHEEVLRELESGKDADEYYTLLNVSKTADQDEIRRSYRRLCRIYHPDRHQDESKQKTAVEFFRRLQEAYKVLSDPRTRAIYDRRGKTGLSEDMAIIERTTLPSELIEEYEKLRELWEERSYIQNCNPGGMFKMDVDATSLLDTDERFHTQRQITVEKISSEVSVDAAVTKSSLGQAVGIVVAPLYGQMFGGMHLSLRHLYSTQNWIKPSLLIGSRPALGVEGYHAFSDSMYVTGHSNFSLVLGRYLRYTASASITRRLNESTSGTITVHNLGEATSVKLTHQVSPTTMVSGEVKVGMESSHVKGLVHYQPLSGYLLKAGVQAGTSGVNVLYGIEHDVAKMTTLGGTVLIGPDQGVALKLSLTRASINFRLRIRLSDFVGPAAIFYATCLPLAVYGCVKFLAVAPLLRSEWLKEIREKKAKRAKEVLEKKKMAESAIGLMQETVERIVSTEQAKHGLLIMEAWYGKLFDQQTDEDPNEPKVIDVKIPLQCLVADSKLILRESTKADLPGFYDPCVGEKKFLRVLYEFHGMAHEVTVENSEPLIIPRASHKVSGHGEA